MTYNERPMQRLRQVHNVSLVQGNACMGQYRLAGKQCKQVGGRKKKLEEKDGRGKEVRGK